MDASSNPVRRPGHELHPDDFPLPQKPPIETRADLDSEVLVAPPRMNKDYAALLAMAEEPVTIRIERSSEKFAPTVVDCWVNGKGVEMLVNGEWLELGALPVGQVVTTKRKYVEVLARSRTESIETNVIERDGEDPRNMIQRTLSSRSPVTIVADKNPRSSEWWERVMRGG